MKTSRVISMGLTPLFAIATAGIAFAQESDQITVQRLSTAHPAFATVAPNVHQTGQARTLAGLPNIDSVVNFTGDFFAPGYDPNGNPNSHWFTDTVGLPPSTNRSLLFGAPIVPVALDLRNYDGTPRDVNGHRLYFDAVNLPLVLGSPVFQNYSYSSSPIPTQFVDAVQRAEFYGKEGPNWHTLLQPEVKTKRTMVLIRGTYQFALNPDGSCCQYVLVDVNAFFNALFPTTASDTTTPIGAAENAGEITTKDISTFLFPNTFLTSGGGCCILGFHTYDSEPGTPANGNLEKRYVLDYSSWISPGLFGGSVQDVTALSHELSEIFNDPFVASDGVHNVTPWWLAPNGNCQDILEVGDVIEGLPNGIYPITLNGFTYHPQNEALLSWFEFQSPSTAIDGAYSYPNTTVLTAPSTLQRPNCRQ